MQSLLNAVERAGNRLPNPTWLFIYLCGLIVLISVITEALGLSASHPVDQRVFEAKSLFSQAGLQWALTHTVRNFTQFAPVGTVLVAVLGIGIAERSGLIGVLLQRLVQAAPKKLLSFVVVFAGVMSSIAADAGYVVLVPLAALLFKASGRSPLLGIAAAFAGVSGGYSANLVIGPFDAILAGLTTEAVHLADASYSVSAASNYYFLIASTFLICIVATWVTEVVLAPKIEAGINELDHHNSTQEPDNTAKALAAVGLFTIVFIGLLLLATVPSDGILRNAETGSLLKSPFIGGIVVLVAVYAGIAGMIFGKLSGEFAKRDSIIEAMNSSMATMASYLVLMFFAAQFVNYFAWTDLGIIFAIKGAATLAQWQLSPLLTLALFVVFSASINLIIGSGSAKWALLAPVFVPMFFLLDIPPEAVQMAYRIGDSSTNIITPLMPYFGVVVAYAQRYKPDIGIGNLVAMMLPYSLVMLFGWTLFFLAWIGLGWPLGA